MAKILIIGAGIGGLVSAINVAMAGHAVTVFERASTPGGKMRQVEIDGAAIDAGPTVFTMRHVFDDLFASAGANFEDFVDLTPMEILARHAWDDSGHLDLFADDERSVDAIGSFAGLQSAKLYRSFCNRAQATYQALEQNFIQAPRPNPISLSARLGIGGLMTLSRVSPFRSLWDELGRFFPDPRLRQLFGRYATYCGGSPFLSPGILMLIAHVEKAGVYRLKGGMFQLAKALHELGKQLGIDYRFNVHVDEILMAQGRVSGIRLSHDEQVMGDGVILNADPAALANGAFGHSIGCASGLSAQVQRSLSAMTFSMKVHATGFDLDHHNVFFSPDYRHEFDDIIARGTWPADPTVYVCAPDRPQGSAFDLTSLAHPRQERLFCLVNAPANGDQTRYSNEEIERCKKHMIARLAQCGLKIDPAPMLTRHTGPAEFNQMFPMTGGALYGQTPHGWQASFRRPASRTKVPGLYLAGGATHPGPGVPMAALSGRLAAAALLADQPLTAASRKTGMSGGILTPGAMTGRMR
jgi:1-hydroxycarotenoid 3,4-desaturase